MRDKNTPTVCGTGYIGYGEYKTSIGRYNTKCYTCWKNILTRCYDSNRQIRQKTYKDVIVCEVWKCFQNFAQWYEQNYLQSFVLDKDILVKGNKVYSPETCCFVPTEINHLFTKRQNHRGNTPIGVHKIYTRYHAIINIYGESKFLGTFNTPEEAFQVYKNAKEKHIKEIADKWKGQIKEEVYQAMYNYKVEITD